MVGVAYPFARGRFLEPKSWKIVSNLPNICWKDVHGDQEIIKSQERIMPIDNLTCACFIS
jgi:hypothetical protein